MAAAKRRVELRLIQDADHHDEIVMKAIAGARVSVWISTANVKDLRVEAPVGTRARAQGRYVSILEILDDLARRGVELRMLHAGAPSRAFQESLRRTKLVRPGGLSLRQCPRVHLKMIAVDGAMLYLGSANFTGAGLGAKSERRRNFEAGIATDDDVLLDAMQGTFERIWTGRECGRCALRGVCPKPIDTLLGTKATGPAKAPPAKASTAKTPATKTPATKTPAAKTPAAKTPAAKTPAAKTPATKTPATKTPAAKMRARRPERTARV